MLSSPLFMSGFIDRAKGIDKSPGRIIWDVTQRILNEDNSLQSDTQTDCSFFKGKLSKDPSTIKQASSFVQICPIRNHNKRLNEYFGY